jgi:hypothetical protein
VRYRFVFSDHSFILGAEVGKLVAGRVCALYPWLQVMSIEKPRP